MWEGVDVDVDVDGWMGWFVLVGVDMLVGVFRVGCVGVGRFGE